MYKDRREYEHEHEWRMLYYNLDNEDNYEFIPDVGCLKAIYYGPDIEDDISYSISTEFHSISKYVHQMCTKFRKLHRIVSQNALLSYLSERYNPSRLILQRYE